ncbi:T9SS type A sorting domain-containing protein, partial [Bacteroidales bacterium OttesenSCG-928-I14]|nr:T9SS type A sorting domain-containing protein [Bacteroidales bacterium OttesenSCG-928-I14]
SVYCYPIGYDFFIDDELFTFIQPNNTYTLKNAPSGNHNYCIKAVYFTQERSEGTCVEVDIPMVEAEEGINESFTNGLPLCWTMDRKWWDPDGYNAYWLFSSDYQMYMLISGFEKPFYMEDGFAFFDNVSMDAGAETSLITRPFIITAQAPTLRFDVEELLTKYWSKKGGIQLYVEVSTDDGATWETDNTNVLELLPNHNIVSTSGTLEKDLSDYIDETIRIRFRVVGDAGSFLLFLSNVRTEEVIAGPDLMIIANDRQYTQLPVLHAKIDFEGARVANIGSYINKNEAQVEISINPGEHSETANLPAFFTNDRAEVIPSKHFIAREEGVYTISYKAILESDVDLKNNESTRQVNVTQSTFATDNGNIHDGIGGNNAPITLGNIYYLLEEDVVNSFSIAFISGAAKEFTLSIYSADENTGRATELYTSKVLRKVDGAGWGDFHEYEIEPQTLPAGCYLFAISQLAEGNLLIACDTNLSGVVYQQYDGGIYSYSNFGSLMLRVNTSGKLPPESITSNDISNNKVYPTITSGLINIATEKESEVTVTDLEGRKIATFRSSYGVSTFDMNYPDGVYLININSGDNVSVHKIILRRN